MSVPNTAGDPIAAAKEELRREMRRIRASIADRGNRATRVAAALAADPAVLAAHTVMAYRPVGTEVDTRPFLVWCEARGLRIVLPDAAPAAPVPDSIVDVDVVVVPGLAFTADGRRLGQGGGWYDRALPRIRAGGLAIGVGFAEQIVDDLPTEPHDVRLDRVITDRDA